MGRRGDVESSLGELSLSAKSGNARPSTPPRKKVAVADSWDEDISSGEDTETDNTRGASDFPNAPPPTPISPLSPNLSRDRAAADVFRQWDADTSRLGSCSDGQRLGSRPEKTDAVAKRMIAGALGVRAPKKTDEQKEYEKAIKEKEAKKKNQERDAKRRAEEEANRAKAAVWET
ncbi:MAG: hypothetical protein M1833_007085 [Piccolia ochrophora]|nr:MAG: hypothetical protein M1833_007085 [Piccolia ochrophora]